MLTAQDLGAAGSLDRAEGEIRLTGETMLVRIDFIEGIIPRPFEIISRLKSMAGSVGATRLEIQATLANERLYSILQKRYNLATVGSKDSIVFQIGRGSRP